MSKRKFIIAKFIIFLIFLTSTIYFGITFTTKIRQVKNDRSDNTTKLLAKLKLIQRKPDFYKNKPIYEKPVEIVEKKDVDKNLKKENNEKKKNELVKGEVKDTAKIKKEEYLKTNVKKEKEDNIDKRKYYIQIATYSMKKYADIFAEELKKYNCSVIEVDSKGKIYYKVVIDNIKSRDEAIKINKKIKGDHPEMAPLIRVRY